MAGLIIFSTESTAMGASVWLDPHTTFEDRDVYTHWISDSRSVSYTGMQMDCKISIDFIRATW